MKLVTLFSAARAAFYTSQGAFAHLRTTPLRWPARDVAIAMTKKVSPLKNKLDRERAHFLASFFGCQR